MSSTPSSSHAALDPRDSRARDENLHPNQRDTVRMEWPEDGPPPLPRPSRAAPVAVTGDGLISFVVEVSARRPGGAVPIDSSVASDQGSSARRRDCSTPRNANQASLVADDIDDERLAFETAWHRGGANDDDIELAAEWCGELVSLPHEVDQPAGHRTPARPIATARVNSPRRRGRRGLPAWSVSMAVHGVLGALLAAVTITQLKPIESLELAFPAQEVDLDESPLPDGLLDGNGDVDSPAADANLELAAAGETGLGDLHAISDLEQLGIGPAGDTIVGTPGRSQGDGLGDVGALFGGPGGMALAASGRPVEPLEKMPSPEFFGTKIEGRRIVFVLDNSGSMQSGRLETVCSELVRCIDSLEADQEFYIVFHSDTVYPLFFPDPVDRFVRPTPQVKRRLAAWLDSVELCMGDSVDEALAIAAMIEPDTVFLLSDGQIHSDRTMRFLLSAELRNFPIHTFAVGLGASPAGRRNLEAIASANGGTFQVGTVPDEMRDLARRRPRPYHVETPGPMWGRNVKPRR